MTKKNDELIKQIETFSSNSLSRFVSKQKLMPFGGDRRKYKYRISLLNSFADLESILENLEASVLGTSGKSIFESIQYLANARRQLNKIKAIVRSYGIKELTKDNLNNINESEINENNVEEIISDYEINKLNFNDRDSELFSKLNDLISVYKSGNKAIADEIKDTYSKLILHLSNNKSATSLEDVLINKADENKLQTHANIINFIKKWYGKAKHHTSLFDETSSVRIDVSDVITDCLSLVQEVLNNLENDLDVQEILNYTNKLNTKFKDINKLMDPLIRSIEGSSFGDEFLDMIQKNKLTDFPANLSKKDRKSFESYLRTREFRSLLNMYEGKE